MRSTFVLSMILASLLSLNIQSSRADTNPLRNAATGQEFSIGRSTFRLLANAIVQRIDESQSNSTSASKNVGIREVSRIGPYRIMLNADSRQKSADKYEAQGREEINLRAAINQRTGLPALVAPRLKIYCNDISNGPMLSQVTNGRIVISSPPAGLIIMEYPSPELALNAIKKLQVQTCVKNVEPEIIQSFDVPN